ncbi:hypothetical protein [Leptolyngbya sp. FACHB-261]|uniref:hypothetical protein n=1 Tax=Leptolyngbya sp. FACHB-261 TaxID=2692806 RepID=UPI001681D761|nr:hypothetical protein [Leptolyngbya sp. FACHB-261]MBD2100632.1 hypothetical protein [Leptolyngbya sp. FACHB-261]
MQQLKRVSDPSYQITLFQDESTDDYVMLLSMLGGRYRFKGKHDILKFLAGLGSIAEQLKQDLQA